MMGMRLEKQASVWIYSIETLGNLWGISQTPKRGFFGEWSGDIRRVNRNGNETENASISLDLQLETLIHRKESCKIHNEDFYTCIIS